MNLHPASVAEMTKLLEGAHGRRERILDFDLSALRRLLEHKVEDMTATVDAGMTLADFQQELAKRGQWLPVDPPNAARLTIGSLLASNASGPRRFGLGTVRDYLIGITAVLADGRVVHAGGKVVKNVAGYDLMKLFIGSHGSLGVIVEATFKVLPRPETEMFVESRCESLEEADRRLDVISDSELAPTVLDLHNVLPRAGQLTLVLGFAGMGEDVEWQVARAAELGFNQPSSLEYEKEFFKDGMSFQKLSVLPSKLTRELGRLNNARFVARAGNGVIYYAGPVAPRRTERLSRLEQRLKDEFDPNHILPDLPA